MNNEIIEKKAILSILLLDYNILKHLSEVVLNYRYAKRSLYKKLCKNSFLSKNKFENLIDNRFNVLLDDESITTDGFKFITSDKGKKQIKNLIVSMRGINDSLIKNNVVKRK